MFKHAGSEGSKKMWLLKFLNKTQMNMNVQKDKNKQKSRSRLVSVTYLQQPQLGPVDFRLKQQLKGF